ncbi:MAG: hypothetical protein ACQEVD_02300 [Actinomycetota bacterium]
MNQITDDRPNLKWAPIDDLEVGEFYTLGVESPLTYLLVGRYAGRGGRTEYDVNVLVGPSEGRAYTKTFWNPSQDVLVIPPEHVGDRLTAAAVAFNERHHLGREHIELGSDCFPWCAVTADENAEVSA